MRIVLFSVLVLVGLAGATAAYSASCPQGWTLTNGSCVNPPDLVPPPLPSTWMGPPPIVTTADRAAELMAEYRLKAVAWDAIPVDVIDEELLLAADLTWWKCYEENKDNPFRLDGCELDWYAGTGYFEHNYDIEPPWERD